MQGHIYRLHFSACVAVSLMKMWENIWIQQRQFCCCTFLLLMVWIWCQESIQSSQKASHVLAAPKELWPAGKGRWSCPSTMCRWDLYSVGCWVLSTGENWIHWNACRGPQKWFERWNVFCEDRQRELGQFRLEKRRLWKDLVMSFQYLKKGFSQQSRRAYL